jgi:transcription elongation factor Elf1
MNYNRRRSCPSCGEAMRLARTLPKLGNLAELYTFECRSCGVSETIEAELQDREVAPV